MASLEKVGLGPLYLVSRLDQPTSGVLPLALGYDGSTAVNWLQAQFAGRLVEKDMGSQWAMMVGNFMEVPMKSMKETATVSHNIFRKTQ